MDLLVLWIIRFIEHSPSHTQIKSSFRFDYSIFAPFGQRKRGSFQSPAITHRPYNVQSICTLHSIFSASVDLSFLFEKTVLFPNSHVIHPVLPSQRIKLFIGAPRIQTLHVPYIHQILSSIEITSSPRLFEVL